MKRLSHYRIIFAFTLFALVACPGWIGRPGLVHAAGDWKAPVMADYVKVPPFASYSVKPNIMIALDNSGSMNYLAYSGDFKGAPYNGLSILSLPLADATDDMEENASGVLRDAGGSGNDLDFWADYSAIRFQEVEIPQGAIITGAFIEFTASYLSGSPFELEIRGEAADDAAFLDVTDTGNISDRVMTTAMQTWTPAAWVVGTQYKSDDLSTIVQEIVNRGGWEAGNAMLFRVNGAGWPSAPTYPATDNFSARSREVSESSGPILHVTFFDPTTAVRYYGYFNPDYFYTYASNVFNPKYKKIQYNHAAGNWTVEDLSGATLTIDDGDIAPGIPANGLWDGNWLNWVCMRRVDVLRKVLMGGKATSRTGGGNQQNYAEAAASWRDQSKFFSSSVGPATSPYKGNYTYKTTVGYLEVNSTKHTLCIQKDINIEPQDFFEGNLAGILQRIGDRARWANMWFNTGTGSSQSGGYVANPMDNGFGVNFLPDLQNQSCETWTPLAETFYVAMLYYMQEDAPVGYDYVKDTVPNSNDTQDPFYDKDAAEFVPCSKNFVLMLTDGASTKDGEVPSPYNNFDDDKTDGTSCDEASGSGCDYGSGGTDFLDDVALYARTQDLRSDLDGDQNVLLYTVYAFDNDPNARALLKDAARNGGFEDINGNGKPDGDYGDPAEDRIEWDKDSDGDPDTYYEASDGYTLETELMQAIDDILARATSGTAASVISNSRSGEGAIYQSIFYPATTAVGKTVNWVGQVHSLFTDEYGRIHEDTNQNQKLDLGQDMYVAFEGTVVEKDLDHTKLLNPSAEPAVTGGIEDIKFLWDSNSFLNDETLDTVNQRTYGSTAKQRYIFTFVDDGDMAAESGEVKDFTAATDPSWADMIDTGNFLAYLHTYEPFNPPIPTTDANYQNLVRRQAKRLVNFIRGQDQGFETIGTTILPATRNRQIDYDKDGTVETWRLGDIVFSTPVLSAAPAEKFDLIYHDVSSDKGYLEFYLRYKNRRNVIYVGANDGMVHAFNGGFWNQATNGFESQPVDQYGDPISDGRTYHQFDLGAEMWAYIPFNLLPHLYWLQKSDYNHIYYVDLQPRIFDARIYPGTDTDTNPNGWATVLVMGMRFGGGKIATDLDKDGVFDPAVDTAAGSAYAIFDITDPESPPKLLGEVTFPDLGFTLAVPGVAAVRNFEDVDGKTWAETTNEWYLVFGSGPASEDPYGDDGPNNTALIDGTSSQKAVMYAVDLVKLANDKQLVTLTASGKTTYAGSGSGPYYFFQSTKDQSMFFRPVAFDWNRDFTPDALYYGESSGDHSSGWEGRLQRLVIQQDSAGVDPNDPTTWITDSTLVDLSNPVIKKEVENGQPIVAPATGTVDGEGERWVYFGTGRFFSMADKLNTEQQSYYGVKEPNNQVGLEKQLTYDPVAVSDLLDTTDIEIGEGDVSAFRTVDEKIKTDYQGWTTRFSEAKERNLGWAVLAGDLLTFTTYIPSSEICGLEGESMVYALHYRTGTAYYESVFGLYGAVGDEKVSKQMSLGIGLTITPNIHVGRSAGSTAYIQTSTGAIERLEQANPGVLKSSPLGSLPEDWSCEEP